MMRHYVIVRSDLPVGVAMAQVVHGAGESAGRYGVLPSHTIAIVLDGGDEYGLFRAQKLLLANNIPHVPIVESDPPYAQQLMAIGVLPTADDVVVKLLKPFQLIRDLKEE